MKRILLAMLIVAAIPICGHSFGIVNNSGSTAADSIALPFYNLDSTGNINAMAANDTVRYVIFYPSGTVAASGSLAYNATGITASTTNGVTVYSLGLAIADIDGAGKDGLYSYIIYVKDNNFSALATPQKGYFQLYQAKDYNTWASFVNDSLQSVIDTLQSRLTIATSTLKDTINAIIDTVQNQDNWIATSAMSTLIRDSVYGIIDTLQNHDNWVATATALTSVTTTVGNVRDTVNAAIDTLQNHDNWIATASALTSLTTTVGNVKDTVNGVIDTLQNHDNWVASAATQTLIKDSVYAALDTLQNQDNWVATSATQTLIRDSVYAALDTLQNQDNWIATATALSDVATDADNAATQSAAAAVDASSAAGTIAIVQDSVQAILDTVQNHEIDWAATGATSLTGDSLYKWAALAIHDSTLNAVAFVDSVWNEPSSGHTTAGTYGLYLKQATDSVQGILDTVQNQDNWIATAAMLTLVRDTVYGIIDTVQNQDGWIAQQTTLTTTQTTLGNVRDTVNAIIDTTQNQDGWIATASALTSLATTVGNVRDTVNALIDTAQNQDGWIATAATQTAIKDSVQAILDTIQNHEIDWAATAASSITGDTIYKWAATAIHDSTIAASALADSVWGADTASTNQITGSYGAVLWQGAGTATISGAAMQSIADSVWNTAMASHTAAGTFGADAANWDATAASSITGDTIYKWAATAIHDSTISAAALADTVWGADTASTNQIAGSYGAVLWTGGGSVFSIAQRDSLLNFINDMNFPSQVIAALKLTYANDTVSTLPTSFLRRFYAINDSTKFATSGQLADSVWYQPFNSGTTWPTASMGDSLSTILGGGAATDWTAGEKENIRYALGITGTKTATADGELQTIATDVANLDAWAPATDAVIADTVLTAIVVDSVLKPVTVGVNDDKTDYDLSTSALSNVESVVWNAPFNSGSTYTTGSFGDSVATLLDAQVSTAGGSGAADWSTAEKNQIRRALGVSGSTQATSGDGIIDSIADEVVGLNGLQLETYLDSAHFGIDWGRVANQSTDVDLINTGFEYVDTARNATGLGGGSGSCIGDSGFTVWVTVIDTSASPDSVVPNTMVYFNITAQNGDEHRNLTDETGRTYVNLEAGTYVRFITAPDYAPKVDTFTVAGTRTDTLRVYKDANGRTTVAWIIKRPNNYAYDRATMTINLVSVNDSILHVGDSINISDANSEITDTADVTGIIRVNLWANSLFTNDSTYYVATTYDRKGNVIERPYKFRVPESDTTVYGQNLTRWR